MALRGNLTDFTLPDVFQLIALSKKTGVLRMRRADGAEGNVWFRNGDVFFAESNWHRERLGERLVTAQKITPSALARALQLRALEPPNGRRLGRILVDEGYITDAVLEAFVRDQVLEPIFDLMRWEEGDFDFETTAVTPEEDIGLAVSIENIVMEGARRLEEWERIKKKIPSMGLVFRMATAPGEGTFEISLKPIEWNLLLLVDGTRTVAELARVAHWTEFDVARVIYGLYSAGLLEVATDDEVARLRAERARRDARSVAGGTATAPAVPTAAPQVEVAEAAGPGAGPGSLAETPPASITPPAETHAPVQVAPGPPEAEFEAVPPPAPAAPQPPTAAAPAPAETPAAEAQLSETEPVPVPVRVIEPAAAVEPAAMVEPAVVAEPMSVIELSSVTEPGLRVEAVPEVEGEATPAPRQEAPLAERIPLVEPARERSGSVEPAETGPRGWVEVSPAHIETVSFIEQDSVVREEVREIATQERETMAPAAVEEDLAELGLIGGGSAGSSPVTFAGASVAETETVEPRPDATEAGVLGEAEAEVEPPAHAEVVEEPRLLLDSHGDAGLRSALADEISALTGVERTSRPTAPSPGGDITSAVPRRDSSIDRETLLDIIEGIKRL